MASRGRSAKVAPDAAQHRTAGPYSPVLEVRADTLVVISGQAPIREDGSLYPDDFDVQARETLKSCLAQLRNAGCGFEDVFKVNVYLTDLGNWEAFNRIYAEMMPEPRPVRTAVAAGLLHNFLVEVEMWAAKP